jgi:hypothetical protein
MKNTMMTKLAAWLVGTTSALLLFGGSPNALAADLTASAHNGMTSNQSDSLVSFNLNTTPTQENILNASEVKGDSGMNKWVASIYYLMMSHLILSFILAAKNESEEA